MYSPTTLIDSHTVDDDIEQLENLEPVDWVHIVMLPNHEQKNAAWNLLYKEYRYIIFSICLSIVRNTQSAEDVMQDVFTTVTRKISQLKNADAFLGWLKQSAKNHALTTLHAKEKNKHAVQI